jgi:hypothetical protein
MESGVPLEYVGNEKVRKKVKYLRQFFLEQDTDSSSSSSESDSSISQLADAVNKKHSKSVSGSDKEALTASHKSSIEHKSQPVPASPTVAASKTISSPNQVKRRKIHWHHI